ncbi:MAG: hypothetical protein ACT6T3_21930 [Agrobacterium sp.]
MGLAAAWRLTAHGGGGEWGGARSTLALLRRLGVTLLPPHILAPLLLLLPLLPLLPLLSLLLHFAPPLLPPLLLLLLACLPCCWWDTST